MCVLLLRRKTVTVTTVTDGVGCFLQLPHYFLLPMAKGATCRLLAGVVQLLLSMGHASLSHEGASGARALGGR